MSTVPQDAAAETLMATSSTGRDCAVVATVLVASAAMLLWMSRSLFAGEVPFTGDLLHFHYPLRDFYAGALARGQSFDWMPSLYNGFYVVGEGQLGAYHPMHWLLYRFLPLDAAFAIELVVAYPVLFAGTLVFLRQWCRLAPAAFGAMLFTFCGFTLSHGVHPNMVIVVAHMPWILWAIHGTFAADTWHDRIAGCAIVGLLTGSQLLLGHPQAVWLSGLMAAAYSVLLMTTRPRTASGWSALSVACGLLLGVAVGAVQVLATLHAVQGSDRTAFDTTYATTFALAPSHLLQLLEPDPFWGRVFRWTEAPAAGDEFAAYGGAVALVLTVWWLASYPARRRRGDVVPLDRLALCAAGFGILGLWLATGSHGKLYYAQTWLPIVGQFRVPARFVLFTQFSLAVTAAVALAGLLRRPVRRDRGWLDEMWAPWVLVAASLAAAVWLVSRDPVPSSAHAMIAVAAGPVLFMAAAGLLTLAVRGARWPAIALVLLAAGDQAVYGLGGVVAWQDFLPRQDIPALLDTQGVVLRERGRLAHGGFPDLYTLEGYSVIGGYAAITPARQLDYRSPKALSLAHAAYADPVFQESAQVPGAEALANGWYALPDPLPRARLVTHALVSVQPAVDLAGLDVDHSALTTRELELAGGPPGHAVIVEDDPGEIRLRTEAPNRQLLVVSESYDEGWVASIDGEPAAVERVNGDFIGCVVPAGGHDVTFEFRPAHLLVGKTVSLSGLALALVLIGGSRTRRRSVQLTATGRGE